MCEQSEKHNFRDAPRSSETTANATNKAPESKVEDAAIFNAQNVSNKTQLAHASSFHLNHHHPHYQGNMYYAQPNIAQNFFQYPNRAPYWNPAYCYPSAQHIMAEAPVDNKTNVQDNVNFDPQTIDCSPEMLQSSPNVMLPNSTQDANIGQQDQSINETDKKYVSPENLNHTQQCISETDFPSIPHSMQLPQNPQGCGFFAPILPPTPVCSNCNHFMVPAWRCPSGHSEFSSAPITNPNVFLPIQPTNPIDPTQCSIPNHQLLYPNVSTPLMHSHLTVPSTMMPNHSLMMVPQPMRNHSQIYHHPLPLGVNQEQSRISTVNEENVEPLLSARSECSNNIIPMLENPQAALASNTKLQVTSPRSESHNQENTLLRNSMEVSKQTSESQQRFHRSFEQGLWNGMYNRRSNGLDPGYDHLTINRMRINASEPIVVADDCSVNHFA